MFHIYAALSLSPWAILTMCGRLAGLCRGATVRHRFVLCLLCARHYVSWTEFLCFSHNYHCYAASLLSLYHFRLIYGGLAGLCCWAPYSDSDCCVKWALSSCSLGLHLFLTTIFATHIFIQFCSHPYTTLCHGGLAGLGHQALHSGKDRLGGLCHWVLPLLGPLWWICGLLGRISFGCTPFPPFLCHMGDLWWPTWPVLHCLPLPCISLRIRHDIAIPYQAAGFHALLLCALWYPHQVFWVPCTATGGTLLYHARLPGSMYHCYGHIVIPCRVVEFHALL